jgi:hypothetical protein
MDMRRPLCERTAQYVQAKQKKSGWNRGEQSSLMRMITYQGLFYFTGKLFCKAKTLREDAVCQTCGNCSGQIETRGLKRQEEVIDRMKRIVDFFKNIPDEIIISKRELLLTIAVSVLGGMVIDLNENE